MAKQMKKAPTRLDPQVVLDRLHETLAANHLRIADLMRSRYYNPYYASSHKDSLNATELQDVFGKAGLQLTVYDIRGLMDYIDADHSGTLGIDEIINALRVRKRGQDVKEHEKFLQTKKSTDSMPKERKWHAKDDPQQHPVHFQAGHMDPLTVLDHVQELLFLKHMRLVDMFRHHYYNPSYVNGQECLSAGDLHQVLARAGLVLDFQDVERLMQQIDADDTGTVEIDELEQALRSHRRGIAIWETAEFKEKIQTKRETEKTKKETVRRLNQKALADLEEAMHQVTQSGGDPCAVLDCMLKFIAAKQLRVADFFRNQLFNPVYKGRGDDVMTADAVQETLAKAGLMLDVEAIKGTMRKMAIDRSGDMTIAELEQALLLRRKGLEPWKTEEFKSLRAEAEANSTKAPPEDFNAQGMVHRLYDDYKDRVRRHNNLQKKYIEEEKDQIDKTRVQRRSPSPKPVGTGKAGHRLHGLHKDIEEKRKKNREEAVAVELVQLDVVANHAAKRGVTEADRNQTLFQEATDRRARAKEAANNALEFERDRLKNEAVGRNARPMSPERLDDLHNAHQRRLNRLAAAEAESQTMEDKKIQMEIEDFKAKHPTRKGPPRVFDNNNYNNNKSPRLLEKREASPVGHAFGSGRPRMSQLGPAPPLCDSYQLEPVDHALAKINAVVSLRCGMAPEDASEEVLQELALPLKHALEDFRVAESVSKDEGKGSDALKRMPSMSLFNNGCLLEDHEGCQLIREPDRVNQLHSDLEELLKAAELAQEVLMAKVAVGEGKEVHHLRKRWPEGGKWQHPAIANCLFAYNPGVKKIEQARSKAWVRYATSAGAGKYKHLTDVARLGLVFENSTHVRAGLEEIKDKFEVVNIRNYYHAALGNLLGEHFVEVLVVLVGRGLEEPFIAELRLEEAAFFEARQSSARHLNDIKKGFRTMYERTGLEGDAVEYLARYALQLPKVTHSLTIFRRHLARRYGSTVVAWRKAFGNRPNVSFQKFAEACQTVNNRQHIVEHWQELDPTLSGCVCLFDLDAEAVILLAKVNLRLRGLVPTCESQDAEEVFSQLTKGLTLQRRGEMVVVELRNVLRPLGFTQLEADRIFSYLDGHGGSRNHPPATINVSDLAWLLRLPSLMNLSPAVLGKTGEASDLECLAMKGDAITSKGARALSPPAALLGRHSRLSVMSSGDAEAAFPQRANRRSQSPATRPPRVGRQALCAADYLLPSKLQLEGDAQSSGQPAGQKCVMPLPLALPDSSPAPKARGDSEVASPPVAWGASEQLAAQTPAARALQKTSGGEASGSGSMGSAGSLREKSPSQRSLGVASGHSNSQRAPGMARTESQRSLGASPSQRVFGTSSEFQTKGSTSSLLSRGNSRQSLGHAASTPVARNASQKSVGSAAPGAKQSSSSLQGRSASQKTLGSNSGSVPASSTSSLVGRTASQKPADDSDARARAATSGSVPVEIRGLEEDQDESDEEEEEEEEQPEGLTDLERDEEEKDAAGEQGDRGLDDESDGTTF